MWQGKRVSVVLPTYNERDSIRASIEAFFASGVVDEVVVVNNNAAPGTSSEVAKTAAREVFEPRQGYGVAIRRGLFEATGDLLIVSEPDGTFLGHDVRKLLAYSDDFDIVYGSRTVNDFIWEGANMGLFLRWGNWAVAKLMELLFNTTSLTDVGCTTRLLTRKAYNELAPFFTVDGNFFGPEMMLLSVHGGLKVVQIPVNYLPRVGVSSVTGDFWKALFLGLRMIALILEHRFKRYVGWKPGQKPTDLSQVPAGLSAASIFVLLIAFLGFAGAQLNRPWVIDEMDFPALGRAIARTGLPFYYRGEDLPRYPGIFHVPLYGYVLGGWIKIFGESISSIRAFSVLSSLLAFALGFRILSQLCREARTSLSGPALFYGLFLLPSPFWIQSALLPDIDGTVLIVAFLATLTLLVDWAGDPTPKRTLVVGLVLGFAFLAKLTTTVSFIVLVPLAAIFGSPAVPGWKRGLRALAIMGLGVGLFVAVWGALAHFAQVDFWYPFKFTLLSAAKGTAGGSRLVGILNNLIDNQRQIEWWGFPLSILTLGGLIAGVISWIRRASRSERLPAMALVVVAAASILAIFPMMIGTVFWFCKYFVVGMPLWAALAAFAFGRLGPVRFTRRQVLAGGFAFVVLTCWMVYFERDRRLFPFAPHFVGYGHHNTPWVAFAFLALVVAGLWGSVQKGLVGRAVPIFIALYALAFAEGLGTDVAQVRAKYATRYYYGERGLIGVTDLLREQLGDSPDLFSAKDVAVRIGKPYFDEYEYLRDPAKMRSFLADYQPKFVVARTKFEFSILEHAQIERMLVARGYSRWRQVDDFIVFRRNASGETP
jgi:glycosyltransferase involved in cell wall biosynthesis